MNVLGWTTKGGAWPQGVTSCHHAGLFVLLTEADKGRERLALQVGCFIAGCDLLPVAPTSDLSFPRAQELSQIVDLHAQLHRLNGMGQLTISLTHTQMLPIPTQPTSGRQWIRSRKARQDKMAQNQKALNAIIADLGIAISPMRHQVDSVQCDILIKRNDVTDTKESLANRAATIDTHPNTSLLVTGPWPPFGFTDLNRQGMEAA